MVQAGLERNSPLRRLQDERQRLDEWNARAQRAALHLLELRRAGRQGAAARLQALNPLSVLERGYAVVLRPDGSLLTRAAQAQPGQAATVRLADGTLAVKIDAVEKNL